MQPHRVTSVIEREGDGYAALCPELDIASRGDTIEAARANLEEPLGLFSEAANPAQIADRFHRGGYVTHLDVAVQ